MAVKYRSHYHGQEAAQFSVLHRVGFTVGIGPQSDFEKRCAAWMVLYDPFLNHYQNLSSSLGSASPSLAYTIHSNIKLAAASRYPTPYFSFIEFNNPSTMTHHSRAGPDDWQPGDLISAEWEAALCSLLVAVAPRLAPVAPGSTWKAPSMQSTAQWLWSVTLPSHDHLHWRVRQWSRHLHWRQLCPRELCHPRLCLGPSPCLLPCSLPARRCATPTQSRGPV